MPELHAVMKSHGSHGDPEECSGAYERRYDGPDGHDAPHVEIDDEKSAR